MQDVEFDCIGSCSLPFFLSTFQVQKENSEWVVLILASNECCCVLIKMHYLSCKIYSLFKVLSCDNWYVLIKLEIF